MRTRVWTLVFLAAVLSAGVIACNDTPTSPSGPALDGLRKDCGSLQQTVLSNTNRGIPRPRFAYYYIEPWAGTGIWWGDCLGGSPADFNSDFAQCPGCGPSRLPTPEELAHIDQALGSHTRWNDESCIYGPYAINRAISSHRLVMYSANDGKYAQTHHVHGSDDPDATVYINIYQSDWEQELADTLFHEGFHVVSGQGGTYESEIGAAQEASRCTF